MFELLIILLYTNVGDFRDRLYGYSVYALIVRFRHVQRFHNCENLQSVSLIFCAIDDSCRFFRRNTKKNQMIYYAIFCAQLCYRKSLTCWMLRNRRSIQFSTRKNMLKNSSNIRRRSTAFRN